VKREGVMDGESDEDENELARVKCGECECD